MAHHIAISQSRPLSTGRTLLLATVVATAAVVSGCAKHSTDNFTVGSVQHTYKTRHPIVIRDKEQTLDIPVASQSYDLPHGSKMAVRGFAQSFMNSANGSISIMLPTGSANERGARTVAKGVHYEIEQAGVPPHRISMITYFAGEHGSAAPIRLSYNAVKATVSGCGKWPADLTEHKQNQNYHNFGCATQSNLATIIANPADLLAPRGMTEIDAERRSRAIDRYREGLPDVSLPSTIF